MERVEIDFSLFTKTGNALIMQTGMSKKKFPVVDWHIPHTGIFHCIN